MKSILLASVATVGFAGMAAAEISWGGDASIGYNSHDNTVDADGAATGLDDNEFGFYHDLSITASLSQELDNGVTVAASIDLTDLTDIEANYELSITSDMAGLYFGDTAMAAEEYWSGTDGMDHDGFFETDGHEVLRGEVMVSGFTFAISTPVYGDLNGDGTETHITESSTDFLQVAAVGDMGQFNVGLAYQADGFTGDSLFGISAGATMGAADVDFAYAKTGDASSLGVAASMPAGPVTLGVYYAMNDDGAGTEVDKYGVSADYANGPIAASLYFDTSNADDAEADWGLEGSYDIGNGMMAYAGIVDAGEDLYVAMTYDLGGGASLLASYADDGDADNADDEIGDPEYQIGATVEISFAF